MAVDAQIIVFIQRTTDDGPRAPTFGSELPFPLSGELLLQNLDQGVLKDSDNGPGNTDILPQQTSLTDMSVHKTEGKGQPNRLAKFSFRGLNNTMI